MLIENGRFKHFVGKLQFGQSVKNILGRICSASHRRQSQTSSFKCLSIGLWRKRNPRVILSTIHTSAIPSKLIYVQSLRPSNNHPYPTCCTSRAAPVEALLALSKPANKHQAYALSPEITDPASPTPPSPAALSIDTG